MNLLLVKTQLPNQIMSIAATFSCYKYHFYDGSLKPEVNFYIRLCDLPYIELTDFLN